MKDGQKALAHLVGAVVLFFTQWAISVLLVRLGGYWDAGVFSLAISMSNIFSTFARYGIRTFQISDVKYEYTQRDYLFAYVVTVTVSIVACLVYLNVAAGYNGIEKWAILLYLAYNDANVIGEVLFGRLQLKGHLEINGYSNIIRGTLCFALFVGTYILTKNIVLSLALMAAGTIAVLGTYDIRMYRRYEKEPFLGRPFSRKDFASLASLLRVCFPLMAASILPIITTALPRRTIQRLLGEEMLGYFSSIFTITVLISTMVPLLIQAFLPKMANLWSGRKIKQLVGFVIRCYGGVLLLVLCALGGAALLGKPVLRLLFGEGIIPYAGLLSWGIVATGLNGMTSIGSGILVIMRKNKLVTITVAASLLVAAALSGPAVMGFGIYGAGYVLAIAYFVQVLTQGIIIATVVIRQSRKMAS